MKIKTFIGVALLIFLATTNGMANSLTFDVPNPTIVIPASGSLTYDFTGTIVLDAGFTRTPITFISNAYRRSFNPKNQNVNWMIDANFDLGLRSFTEGVFSGILFTCNIDSENFPGLYKYNPDSLDSKPGFAIEAMDQEGVMTTLRANYTIKLIPGTHKPTTMLLSSVPEPTTRLLSSVPEPASMFLLGLGLVGLAGARRKFQK